ncbi:MAG: hypothetical protein Q4G21_04410 [Dermabacter sp.]|nr:hypothetical protein [Dermabacter sp.]
MSIPLVLAVILALVHLPFAIGLSWVDAREHRLPNLGVLAITGAVACAGGTYALLVPEFRQQLALALTLAFVGGIGAIILALAIPGSIGMGDAKVFPSTLAAAGMLGLGPLVGALAWICIVGAVCSVIVLLGTRGNLKARFAFGPVLLSAPYGGVALTALGML